MNAVALRGGDEHVKARLRDVLIEAGVLFERAAKPFRADELERVLGAL